MNDSPAAILFNIDGYEVTIKDGYAIIANQSGILSVGKDGSTSRFITVDSTGNSIIVGPGTAGTPSGGVVSIQGVVGGTPVPVSASFGNTDVVASGTITANGQTVTTLELNGIGTSAIQITGTWVATLQFEGTVDGTNYVNINVRGTNTNTISTSTTANGLFRVGIAGLRNIRIRCSAFTSGTATITIRQTGEASAVYLIESIPTGNAVIGAVTGSGTFTTTTADTNATGTFNALNAAATVAIADKTSVGFRLNAGTLIGTIVAEISLDGGTAWVKTLFDDPSTGVKDSSIVFSSSNTLIQKTIVLAGGASNARVRVSAFTSGTAAANIRATKSNDPSLLFTGNNGGALPLTVGQMGGSDGTNLRALRVASDGTVRIDPTGTTTQPISASSLPLPTGAATETTLATLLLDSSFTSRINTLGQKTMANSTPVVLSSDQTVIPVSQSGTWTVQPGNTANTTPWLITINQGGNAATVTASNALKVDGSAVTQPISGTVISNIGTTNGLALDATLTGGTQITRITDGTTNAVVKAASTAAVASDPALVVAISPNNTVAVTGTVTATNPSVSTTGSAPPASATYIGGSVTTAAPSYTTGQMSALSLTTGGLLRIDGSGVTQPVSGTVTANAGTGNFSIVGIGSAGTPTGGLLTIQGNPSGTPVPISGTITVSGGTGTSSTFAAAFPSVGTASGYSDGTNMQGARVFDLDSGGGTQYVQGVNLRLTASGGSVEFGTASNPIRIDVTGTTTQPISAVSLPLPTGAATETTLGTRLADATFTARINTLGQKTMANSTPIVISSDQTVIPVSDNGGSLTVDGTITATQGTAAAATAPWATRLSDGAAFYKTNADTQLPAALVGGRLDINAGAWLGSTAPTVGQKTMANSIPIAISSDQSAITVSGTITANAGTGNFTVVQSTAANLRSQTASESTTAAATGTIASLTGGAVTTAAPTYTTGQMNPLSLTTTGLLRTDGSGVTQPVSGTVAATQSGTWTVQPGNTANTTPWLATINQGGNSVAVKAASTAAVATDPALVVAVSPNNTLPVQVADVTATGALGALNATVQLTLAGHNSVGFQLAAGTLIGTIVAEESYDGGTTWNTSFIDSGVNKVSTIVFSSSNTATAGAIIGSGGAGLARIIVSAFTSGTANITLRASTLTDPSVMFAGSAGSTTQPPAAAQIAGYDSVGVLRVPSVKASSTSPTISDQALVVVLSPNQVAIPVTSAPTLSTPGIAFGDPTYASTAQQAVRRTTYTEQTVNFTGSIVSASANDTAAGTGARTVRIYWVDQTGVTAGTEDVTLNGTTNVNLVTTTKCFIERIEVLTAGSGGVNAGIITLRTGAGGGGTIVGTIAAGDNRTFWAHHYVISGKTCNVTGTLIGSSSTVAGNGSVYVIKSKIIGTSNVVETQASDFMTLFGQSSQSARIYGSYIKIAGPSRVLMYVTPVSGTSNVYRGSFDYYDQ